MNRSTSYDFLAPQRIVFAWGGRREVSSLGRTLGLAAPLVCGLPPEIAAGVLNELAAPSRAEEIEPIRLALVLRTKNSVRAQVILVRLTFRKRSRTWHIGEWPVGIATRSRVSGDCALGGAAAARKATTGIGPGE